MYLAVGSRPDIAFTVTDLSKFVQNPGPEHITALKRVCRYLQGTLDNGILTVNPRETLFLTQTQTGEKTGKTEGLYQAMCVHMQGEPLLGVPRNNLQ